MKRLINRFSTDGKVSIALKVITIGILVLLVTGCNSIRLGFNSQPIPVSNVNVQHPVKTYTTNFQTFKNLNPEDLGLHSTGNWVHCRTHGFHDLNNWTDFSYSPYSCRPSQGFTQAAQWNSNWGGPNHWNNNLMWNNRFNQWGYSPNRWSPFGYDRWGYNNRLGNVYYRSYGYYGFNNWNYVPYHFRRSNMNGMRTNPNRTRRTPVRNGRPTRVIRNTNTVVPVNTRPRTIRSSGTRVIKPRRTQTVIPPVRNNNTRPNRTNTNPVIRNNNTRTNTRSVKTNNTSVRKIN